jgi:hypothetical protein
MNSKYSPPKKLKCLDCSEFSINVRFNKTHKINLCVDCFISRQIKSLEQNKKE